MKTAGVVDEIEEIEPVGVPGQHSLGPLIAGFDRWVDDRLEALRGTRVADGVFTTASRLGEFSLVWHLANVGRGLSGCASVGQIPRLAVLLGAESIVVNQGIKRIFRRTRPTTNGDARYALRRPLSSSFPSGHASAAAFAASVLTRWDGRRLAPLWWSIASVVATSRAYVRIHHASDVVAGLVTGRALARLVRRQLG